jgi:putative transposase
MLGYGCAAGESGGAMKASRFSDAQKAFILKQADEGVPIGDVCGKAGISQATFYGWRKNMPDCCRRRCGG